MTVPLRAALYLRVSTARQAEHDVSIPDQKRQGEAYCEARGYQLVETYVEPGASATNDRRPEFQRMIEAGTSKPAPFDIVVVHSFSRFFRDHFELEFYVRRLAKNGVNELAGDTAFTMDDLAVAATARLNRKVTYRDLPPAEYQAALLGMGLHQMIVDHNAG